MTYAANDNHPATFAEYEASGDVEPNRGRAINIVADDMDPIVARNVALHYEQKEETWAYALAGRIRSAGGVRVAANDAAKRRRAA